ncbi:alpha/beta hydrolase [uncultured Shewanella sp.]|uniref:alpha/beta hydrolase n=1 Tax=uncultured Shewanella sp. TaxID=173975 RepID=UPI002603BAC8|nr:alpha/beta hydrolase [uncultured Shewanella sp.]
MKQNYDEQFDLKKIYRSRPYYLAINRLQSYITCKHLQCDLDVPYGNTRGQKLDIFAAPSANAPVFVFIHGGYFKALDKKDYRFIAANLVKKGYTTVLLNYDLAPKVTILEIIQQVFKAFSWILTNISQWNGNINQITLCGHSVGAFLACKILEQDRFNHHSFSIEKTLLLSGLYDLGPMKYSYLNTDLQISNEDVKTLSPIYAHLILSSRILICVGKDETAEFIRQSSCYSKQLADDGKENHLLILPQTNHYRMMRYLAGSNNAIINFLSSDH